MCVLAFAYLLKVATRAKDIGFPLSVLISLAEFWIVFSMSVAEWWLILGDEPHSEQAARESVSFSPQDSWCQVRSCLNYQVCNAAPVVLFICSWYFQTPLTVKARALCNVLRSSEVWGNERTRKRFNILEKKESVHLSGLGRKEGGVMTARYSPVY